MNFQQQKRKQLMRKDKSDKGEWDRAIVKLCKKINSKEEYYTTSSCAGRIILIKASEEKKPGLFLFRTHNKITFKQLKQELRKIKETKIKDRIYFKQEPCILHVACKSIEDAGKIVEKAREAGWKRSGIMTTKKRIVCELMSTEHIAFPIMDKGKLLIDDNFLKIVVGGSNKKLMKVREKIKKFEFIIEKRF